MRASLTSKNRPPGIAELRTLTFRMSWLVPALVLLALYLGFGGWRPWAFLALIPAWLAVRSSGRSAVADPLGRLKWFLAGLALLAAVGNAALPLHTPEHVLDNRDREDREAVATAVDRIQEHLENTIGTTLEALTDPTRGPGTRERLESVIPDLPAVIQGSVALALFRGEGETIAWAGSPWLVPARIDDPGEGSGSAITDDLRFVIAGDELSAMAYVVKEVPGGTLVAAGLLARDRAHPDLAPGSEPLLDLILPDRVAARLIITSGGIPPRTVTIEPGPWSGNTIPWPGRGAVQVALLCFILIISLLLLGRDNSIARGLSAAPVIYASVVPLVLGAAARPLSLDLIAPSWTGHQLINQAFLAVAAAGLALWFALGVRARLKDAGGHRFTTLQSLSAGLLLLVIWPVGLALLQDLFRFAPGWFWARVSFLPPISDLIGWLIAIAMILGVTSFSAGAAALIRNRYGRPGYAAAAVLALSGGVLARVTGAWDGALLTGALTAVVGTAGAALWLRRSGRSTALATLLGIGVVSAVTLLPVKGQLGRVIIRGTVEEYAAGMAGTGVGLTPMEVMEITPELRNAVASIRGASDVLPHPFANPADRQAYLVWRELELDEEELAGGVQIVDETGAVRGHFMDVPDLFDVPDIEKVRSMLGRGEGRRVLTAGSPAEFGIETLLVGVPGEEGAGSLLLGVRRRLLGIMAGGEDRIWTRLGRAGHAEREGRLGGVLFLRLYDEIYGLLALPLNPTLVEAPGQVPSSVIERVREGGNRGAWFRRGGWVGNGADEYYFRLETASAGPLMPGGVVVEENVVERVACLGVQIPGLWGRVVDMLNVFIFFAAALLLLGWLPAAVVAGSGIPIARVLRRVSFQTRLLIPLLVVALVPLVALWLLTRGFILNRERSAWEEGLEQSVSDVQQAVLTQTGEQAAELVRIREQMSGSPMREVDLGPGALWAIFDENLFRVAGTIPDSLAERIPLRDTKFARGPGSFLFRSGGLWAVAILPLEGGYEEGAAIVVRPFTADLLREAASGSEWQVDLFIDGRLRASTGPGPYTAGLLPTLLPSEAEWQGLRGREVGTFSWGELGGLHYLYAYRPITDHTGTAVGTIARRRFGLWGVNDPALNELFTTVASIYLLLVVAVTLVALLVASRISQPIGDLTRSAVRVAGGDLGVEIPVTRGDEVGGLQKAFRQMVIALRENRDELARAERERAWQEMARQVAHEIKNPLTPMQLSAQFIRRAYDEKADNLDSIVSDCTDTIVEQVEALRRIANEFSAYARLPVVNREPTDLNVPVEDALNLFEPALPDGVTLVRDLADDIPEVMLDLEQIRRLTINLIRNSIDAMGEEGTLTVTTGHDPAEVWLQVRDTGEGIAPEVQDRLFEPYFSTRTEGTGLGLAITRAIVDAFGGTLTVDSRPGEGTTMTARFPCP